MPSAFSLAKGAGPDAQVNPPGLTQLSYRAGTYPVVLQRLISYLESHQDPDSAVPALQLNVDPEENWGVGLLQAWAMVIDVLTFYQERIINEGYLRTATERRSIVELVRLIGYELRPGVAASTYLAFTVRDARADIRAGLPLRYIIPSGLAVQSVPTQGKQTLSFPYTNKAPAPAQLPQVFETGQEFEARPAWNAMKPGEGADASGRVFRPGTTSLRLEGTKTGLRTGDAILLIGKDASYTEQSRPWIFALVSTVELDKDRGYTRITWDSDTRRFQDTTPIQGPVVFALRQQAKLYSYTRGGVRYSPLSTIGWSPSCLGLPGSAVHALIRHRSGALFAATDDGLFRSINNGETWEALQTGLTKMKFTALTATPDGRLFAGTTSGALLGCADNGTTWQTISKRTVPSGRASSDSLPRTVIRSLTSYTAHNTTHIAAALDNGVFLSSDSGVTWKQSPSDASGPDTGHRGTAWTFAGNGAGKAPLVGMDTGVFPIDSNVWAHWHPWFNAGIAVLSISLVLLLVGGVTNIPYVRNLVAEQFPIPFLGNILLGYANLFVAFLWYLLLALGALLVVAMLAGWLLIKRTEISGLPIAPFHGVAFVSDGALLASSYEGIFRSTDGGKSWTAIRQNPTRPICSVAQVQSSTLDRLELPPEIRNALANSGVDLSQDVTLTVETLGQRWKLLDTSRQAAYELVSSQAQVQVSCISNIQAFDTSIPGTIFAGSSDGYILRSQDNGDTWENISQNLHLGEVSALLAGEGEIFAAGLVDSSDSDDQWSHFLLQRRQLDLDKLYPSLVPGGWIVLRQGDDASAYPIKSVETSSPQDFKKGKNFTSVLVGSADNLASFMRGATTVFAQSAELLLFDDRPLEGDTLTLGSFVPGLSTGQQIIVSGKRARLRLTGQFDTPPVLTSTDGLQSITLRQGDSLVVMAVPVEAAPDKGEYTWLLRDRNNFVGSFSAPLTVASYDLAEDQDESVSEVVSVQSTQQGAQTTILLSGPLQNIYDRSSVSIYANVVRATHGQTVENEVLGSVDGQKEHDRFVLKQKPLTYTSPVDAERGVPDTLQVLVNQVPWRQVSTLHELDSAQRAYIVRQDSQGNTSLIFGNGEQGAHLPSGREHITATYRFGSGTAGNVPADSLTVLRSRLPGIQQATNPVPASGGEDPESTDMTVINAPRHVQTLQRIVSINDYTYFVRTFPGIAKVQVKPLWNGRRSLVYITVAGEAGGAINADSETYKALSAAISAAAASPAQPTQIGSFELLYFQLKATLVLAGDYTPLAKTVLAQVKNRLADVFSFEKRALGQPVALAEVITVIQGVAGVTAVKLESLSIKDQPEQLQTVLVAKSGRLEAGSLLPAQLLVVNADDEQGIVIRVDEGTNA